MEKVKINIKPLSVNTAWKGQRFKTDAYKKYEYEMMFVHLPKKIEMPEPPYEVHYNFGFSSSLADWDNPVKPLQDILQKRYGFNDKLIKRAVVDIYDVPKGQEFIEFEFRHLDRKENS
jgi:hypothetical protein